MRKSEFRRALVVLGHDSEIFIVGVGRMPVRRPKNADPKDHREEHKKAEDCERFAHVFPPEGIVRRTTWVNEGIGLPAMTKVIGACDWVWQWNRVIFGLAKRGRQRGSISKYSHNVTPSRLTGFTEDRRGHEHRLSASWRSRIFTPKASPIVSAVGD